MKRFLSLLLVGIISLSMVGCGNTNQKEQNETILQIAQNDYAGGYLRLTTLQQDVLEKMKILEAHNYEVMSGNPTDYWAEDNFYFTNFLPVYNEQLSFTSVLNEIDDFAAIQTYIASQLEGHGYNSKIILKKEPHNYKLKYDGTFTNTTTWKKEGGTLDLDCIYDPSSNRIKVSSALSFSQNTVYDFYEFAELSKGKYVIQNNKERLYAEYNDAGEITSFYYSSLPDVNSLKIKANMNNSEYYTLQSDYGFDGYVYEVPNIENYISGLKNLYVSYFSNGDAIYFIYNEDTNRYTQITDFDHSKVKRASATGFYNEKEDSIYLDIESINSDWVFEAGYFNQTVKYENGELTVMNTNILTKELSEFTVKEINPDTNSLENTN